MLLHKLLLVFFAALCYIDFEVICMTTGERIKAARKAAGLTQAELAKKLGIPYQSIGQWENNIRNPKYETIQKISKALDVDSLWLMGPDNSDYLLAGAEKGIKVGLDKGISIGKSELLRKLNVQSYSFSDTEGSLIDAFDRLNPDGQAKAVERVEELTEIPKYQKKPSSDESEDG